MAQALVASSTFFLLNASAAKPERAHASACLLPRSRVSQIASFFKSGSPLAVRLASTRKFEWRSARVLIRCEQGAKESGGLDVWLGRLAMVGFASVITVEIVTGKGLLEGGKPKQPKGGNWQPMRENQGAKQQEVKETFPSPICT